MPIFRSDVIGKTIKAFYQTPWNISYKDPNVPCDVTIGSCCIYAVFTDGSWIRVDHDDFFYDQDNSAPLPENLIEAEFLYSEGEWRGGTSVVDVVRASWGFVGLVLSNSLLVTTDVAGTTGDSVGGCILFWLRVKSSYSSF